MRPDAFIIQEAVRILFCIQEPSGPRIHRPCIWVSSGSVAETAGSLAGMAGTAGSLEEAGALARTVGVDGTLKGGL